MRCKDCKYYCKLEQPKEDLPRHAGTCQSPRWGFGYGTIDTVLDFIHVENDEGWGMYCGPEFGCVHFEAKA
jgi:hypothetical protein